MLFCLREREQQVCLQLPLRFYSLFTIVQLYAGILNFSVAAVAGRNLAALQIQVNDLQVWREGRDLTVEADSKELESLATHARFLISTEEVLLF